MSNLEDTNSLFEIFNEKISVVRKNCPKRSRNLFVCNTTDSYFIAPEISDRLTPSNRESIIKHLSDRMKETKGVANVIRPLKIPSLKLKINAIAIHDSKFYNHFFDLRTKEETLLDRFDFATGVLLSDTDNILLKLSRATAFQAFMRKQKNGEDAKINDVGLYRIFEEKLPDSSRENIIKNVNNVFASKKAKAFQLTFKDRVNLACADNIDVKTALRIVEERNERLKDKNIKKRPFKGLSLR